MTLLTAAHLPLLTAKLAQLVNDYEAIGVRFNDASENIFRKNWVDGALNEEAYYQERKEFDKEEEEKIQVNISNQQDIKVAIKECKKQISISNALSLL